MPEPSKRIALLDELRGFAIALMILYHLLFNLTYLFPTAFGTAWFAAVDPFQPIIPFIFISISGVSTQLSRKPLKRGLILVGVSLVITLVTLFVVPDFPIYFGVIHQLAFCILAFTLLRPLLKKVPKLVGLIVSFLLFLLTYSVSGGYLGFGRFTVTISALLSKSLALYPLGLSSTPLSAADYFPVFPWFFLFLFGTYLGVYATEGRFPEWTKKIRVRPLGFIGRHALLIYCAHQPLLYAILYGLWATGLLK